MKSVWLNGQSKNAPEAAASAAMPVRLKVAVRHVNRFDFIALLEIRYSDFAWSICVIPAWYRSETHPERETHFAG